MNRNIFNLMISSIASLILSSCIHTQEEQNKYANIPTPQDGLDVRYFKKRIDPNNTNDDIDYMAIIYNEKDSRREETLLYYASEKKTIEKTRKSYTLAKNGELTLFNNAYDTIGRKYLSINTGTMIIYSTEPKSPGYIPVNNTHTLQGVRRVKLDGMQDTIDVFSFYTPYTYVHEEYYDTMLKLVKFSESYFDLDFSMEQIDDMNVPKHFRDLIARHFVLAEKEEDFVDTCMTAPYYRLMEKEILITSQNWVSFIRTILSNETKECSELGSKAMSDYLKGNQYRTSFLISALANYNEFNKLQAVESLFNIIQADSTLKYNDYNQIVEDFTFLKDYPQCKKLFKKKAKEKDSDN